MLEQIDKILDEVIGQVEQENEMVSEYEIEKKLILTIYNNRQYELYYFLTYL